MRSVNPVSLKTTVVCVTVALALIAPVGEGRAKSLLDSAKGLLNQSVGGGETSSALGAGEIADGLREALTVGSQLVVDNLGAVDGFNTDPVAHIPLPENLQKAQDLLKRAGLGSLGDEVELKMNRAAESAMTESGEIVVNAIQAMTLDDARAILDGPNDAATQYLMKVSGDDIRAKIRPVVDQALSDVGAVAALDSMMSSYDKLPFVPDVKADLTEHATEKAFEGLFHYIAEEEAAIRANPAKRTTELLQKVFAQ